MLRGIACEIDGRWQGPAAVPEGGGRARPQTNVARNFPRSFFETTRKRCNSNDADSRFEILTGELRAKLMCDGRAGSTAVPVNYGAWPRCRWAVAGPGRASRSTTPSRRLACGDLAGGRARRRPEHQRRHRQQKPRNLKRSRGPVAEDGGFEPPRACTQHAFQACAIGH